MTAVREPRNGLLIAWAAGTLLAVVSVLLPWFRIFIDGRLITEVKLGDLDWRGAVYLAGLTPLVVTALVAVLTRGLVRRTAAGIAAAATAVVVVDIASVLMRRHDLTRAHSVFNGVANRSPSGPGPDNPPNGIATAQFISGGLPMALAAAALLLLVVLLAVSGRHRAVVCLGFGTILTLVALVVPWRGAWLADTGSVTYVTYHAFASSGAAQYIALMLVMLALAVLAQWRRRQVFTVIVWVLLCLAVAPRGLDERPFLIDETAAVVIGVDEVGPAVAWLAILVHAAATVLGWRRPHATSKPASGFVTIRAGR